MNTVDVLKGAKALIETKGWRRGGFVGENGCLCTAGAISQFETGVAQRPGPISEQAFAALVAVLPPSSEWTHQEDIIWDWNDQRGRTVQEVLAVFDKAIAAEEAKA